MPEPETPNSEQGRGWGSLAAPGSQALPEKAGKGSQVQALSRAGRKGKPIPAGISVPGNWGFHEPQQHGRVSCRQEKLWDAGFKGNLAGMLSVERSKPLPNLPAAFIHHSQVEESSCVQRDLDTES